MGIPKRLRAQSGRYSLVDGIPFHLPVYCRTSPCLMAAFSINADKARALLPGNEIYPLRLWNKGLLVITVIDYRDTVIGKYIEYSIAIACTHGPRPAPRLPIFMPPVRKSDVWYTDSVWLKDANLLEAVQRGAEELWVLWIINNTPEFKTGFFNQYVHMIEMSANGSLIDEFERINEINARISQGEKPFGHKRPIRLHLIKPAAELPLDPELYLNRITTAGLIDMGYAQAKQYLSEVPAAGLPLQPETLMMTAQTKPGVSFRETMTGGFSLGETDPRTGEKKGDAAGTKLSIHCDIDVKDIYGFIEDAQHFAPITARIDFAPMGINIPTTNAIWNLFSPSDDPKTKHFIYEMAFEHEGDSYYLAGKKFVHDGPGFDMWADITTLFTRLHKGKDAKGPVVGAGVIYIKREQLIGLIPTIHATNTTSAAQSLKVVADFGRFFMGEIWDSYAK